MSVLVCFVLFLNPHLTPLYSPSTKRAGGPRRGGDVAASLLYVTPQRPLLWTRRVLGRDVVATGPPWT